MIQASTLQFLKDLKKNNDRDWFNANKARFVEAQDNVAAFTEGLMQQMSGMDQIEMKPGKKAIMRIYRDVRFSKDKSPYKTRFVGFMKRATEDGHSCDAACVHRLEQLHQTAKGTKGDRAADEPLILTKLIKEGQTAEQLQSASLITPQIGNFSSYSGFFTTDADPKHDNNMFFWWVLVYFPFVPSIFDALALSTHVGTTLLSLGTQMLRC